MVADVELGHCDCRRGRARVLQVLLTVGVTARHFRVRVRCDRRLAGVFVLQVGTGHGVSRGLLKRVGRRAGRLLLDGVVRGLDFVIVLISAVIGNRDRLAGRFADSWPGVGVGVKLVGEVVVSGEILMVIEELKMFWYSQNREIFCSSRFGGLVVRQSLGRGFSEKLVGRWRCCWVGLVQRVCSADWYRDPWGCLCLDVIC